MYTYEVKDFKVIDGDTVDCAIDVGFGITIYERVRIYGINAPEIRTRDLEEKEQGLRAKDRAQEYLDSAGRLPLVLRSMKFRGKFGRVLGDLHIDGTEHTLAETLVNEGLAEEREY